MSIGFESSERVYRMQTIIELCMQTTGINFKLPVTRILFLLGTSKKTFELLIGYLLPKTIS